MASEQVILNWSPSSVVTTMWVALSMMLGLLGLLVFGLFYAVLGAPPPDAVSVAFDAPFVIVLAAALLIAHQLIHAAVSRLAGGAPSLAVDVVQWVIPVFYCRTLGQRFSRSAYLAYLLAPLAVLSLLGLSVMIADYRGALWIIPLALNAGMSTRDIWMAWVVWRMPAGVFVDVQPDGFRVIRPGRRGDRRD